MAFRKQISIVILLFSPSVFSDVTPQISINGVPFKKTDKLRVGDKVTVQCTTKDANSVLSAMIADDAALSPSSGFLKARATVDYTVRPNDGRALGFISAYCVASQNGGAILDDTKGVDLATLRERDRSENPATISSMRVLVNGLPFSGTDKLKVGDKITLECTTKDENSFVKAFTENSSPASTFKKARATVNYTVQPNDGRAQGFISAYCIASQNGGDVIDQYKFFDLKTVREKDRNQNPARLDSMSVRVVSNEDRDSQKKVPGKK